MEPGVEQNVALQHLIGSDLKNCTCREVDDDMNLFNAVTIIVFLPILAVFGLITNGINMWVYSKTHSSAERYLMALSISDFGVCASGILVITSDSLRSHSFYIDQAFTLLLPKLIPFGLFFQTASIYVTVCKSFLAIGPLQETLGAAVDCYVKVSRCFATRSHEYCSVTNANRILVGVFFLTAAYNVIQFGELEAVRCYSHELKIELYELCPTALRMDDLYVTVYRGYLYAIIMAFFPFIILSILTALIVYELHRRKSCKILNKNMPVIETFHEYAAISDHPENNKPVEVADTSSPTVLILVVILFLSCSFVSLLVNICDMFEDSLSYETKMALIDIGNVLVVFNATANFVIYLSSSSYFCIQVKELFSVHTDFEKVHQTQV